jgi:hypothetical protein
MTRPTLEKWRARACGALSLWPSSPAQLRSFQAPACPSSKGIGPTAWLDAVIFAALGAGIGKMSRAAAIGALLLYIVERIAMAPVAGLSPITMIALVLCFVQGVRGTWAFHKFRQQSPGMLQGSTAT